MIFISDFFHISNDTTYISGIKRTHFNFEFPCAFNLFTEGTLIGKITVEGIVLNNNYYIDEAFEKITVWVKGHLDKDLIAGKTDACLKLDHIN